MKAKKNEFLCQRHLISQNFGSIEAFSATTLVSPGVVLLDIQKQRDLTIKTEFTIQCMKLI